jgi:hypothetical protein
MAIFTTSLRPWVIRRIEALESVDLLVGIPCFNSQATIEHVLEQVSNGLSHYYGDKRSLIVISDGGSTDDTREVAEEKAISPYLEKLIAIYRGVPGKGSALRMIFEIASHLGVQACAVVDSDLRSISPVWIQRLLDPILTQGFHFVAPVYTRYKYDGTITNNVVYCLTRALFGKRVRQPIGGDFGFSRELARFYALEEVWDSEVARFGIDIWMTISAIARGLPICQSHLGVKVHNVKDPGDSLGPMFRQVVFTLFSLMEKHQDKWLRVERSEPVPTLGEHAALDPEPFTVDVQRMVNNFQQGYEHFDVLWERILAPDNFSALKRVAEQKDGQNFYLPAELWSKIVYDFAAAFHHWKRNHVQLVDVMSPLYYARVASFVNETRELSNIETEEVIEEQAAVFESLKPYLLEKWQSLT